MDAERQKERRGHIGRGMLLSALLHGGILFPLGVVAFILGDREAAEHADEVDVTFEDVTRNEIPSPVDDEPAPDLRRRKERTLKPRLALDQPPKPEPPLPEEKPPQPVPPKDKKAHEKMVDLDMGKNVPPPPDAKFLAQKNNRAEQETRATDTNLERAQAGTEKSSSPSDRSDQQVGDAKNKIAELEDQVAKRGRMAPPVTPHQDETANTTSDSAKKSLLALRDAARRAHEVTPETADPSLPRDPNALRELPEERLDSTRDLQSRSDRTDKPRLRLTDKDYDYLFGADAEAERRLAQKERSKHAGKFTSHLGRVQSALENFIPEVRPGNQTALNTRAAPFAAFIARMHRSIHKLWGFGFLEDLDTKPVASPLNDPNLATKLELVLNGDGTVDKVTMVRTSGNMSFDSSAIDVAFSAGPYPDPPAEIRSGNGKIYVHWTFHRDERQCATSFVDYYILDNAPRGGDRGDASDGAGEFSRGIPMPRPPTGPKRLQRSVSDTAGHRAKMRELNEAAGEPEPDPVAAKKAAEQVVRSDDPAARAVAEEWFGAYNAGAVDRMVRQASFPFRSSAGVAAKGPGDLAKMLSALLEEAPGKRATLALRLYSAAGARGALGGIPRGMGDGAGLLFAEARARTDGFILVLSRQSGAWKAIGLFRR